MTTARTAAVIPAKDESQRLAATLAATRSIPGVDLVVVVDDGSADETGEIAAAGGAIVVRHPTSRGKGAAMASGAAKVAALDEPGLPPRHLLFLDADLGTSAAEGARIVAPVAAGEADLVIATFRPAGEAGGGHGFVVRLAAAGLQRRAGYSPAQPLNGQRAMTRAAYTAVTPFGFGFGVEVAMTMDAVRAGLRVLEVDVDMTHRVTGTDWKAQRHRGKQFLHVALALTGYRPRG